MKKITLLLLASIAMFAAPRPALVTLDKVTKQEINPFEKFTGTIVYDKSSLIASQSDGKVIEVLFDNGDFVKISQPLLRLDARILKANIDSTKAKVDELKSDLQKADKDFQRYENLYKNSSISTNEYEDVLYKKKKLQYQLKSLDAQLRTLQIQLQDKTIKAPYDGQIVSKLKDIAQWVKVGDNVASIVSDKKIKANFSIPYSIAKNIKPNTPAMVIVDSKEYKATIDTVIKSGIKTTRTFPIEVTIKDATNLFEGVEASINLPTVKTQKVLSVPRDSVINRFNQNVIFVDANGVAQMIPVTVIGYEKDRVGIESPMLSEGMDVVVKGNERVFPNQPLQIIK